jgi:hypothetical protein
LKTDIEEIQRLEEEDYQRSERDDVERFDIPVKMPPM